MTIAKKLPATARQHTGDRALDQVQRLAQQTALAVNKLNASTGSAGALMTSGVLVTSQTITTAGVVVTHSLGRTPIGFVVTRVRSTTAIGEIPVDHGSPTATTWPLITFAGTIVADLYFF